MINILEKILKESCENVSDITEVDLYSKKLDLLKHTVLLVESAISHKDLTDISIDSDVSRSQLSKLDTGRPYQVFVEIFYELMYPYIMAHNYRIYRRFLTITGIDSTFIRTLIKESGKYRREKTESGIKMHEAAVVFPLAVPLESIITPANLNDSPEFDALLGSIDPDLVKQSILTFDLGYYDLDRLKDLAARGIRFVTRIKKNASYTVLKEYAHSRIVRFRNGAILRLVSMEIDGVRRDYLTGILDLPDMYIHWIYSQRKVIIQSISIRSTSPLFSQERGISPSYWRYFQDLSGTTRLMCSLYSMDSYKRDNILLEGYMGEYIGGFTELMHPFWIIGGQNA